MCKTLKYTPQPSINIFLLLPQEEAEGYFLELGVRRNAHAIYGKHGAREITRPLVW